ncbi:zincin [Cylindrobasidium torrendii FP15055 ss-10]|uniref:Neutral protease 2 n=1 Tax=Cylindrobasidium torrendii FP15055 ss-10 TaxID=1314674 RepID=A0A0D7BDN3_9AGAR|nr:zincin [Cylindrobasidium torrendii FP15055 ss-10]
MLFASLALFASAALATPLQRAGGLQVEISAPKDAASVADLSFEAKITNNGAEDLKVLKYGTVLDSLPTRSFAVTKDGAEVDFTGVKLSVSLEENAENAFTVIQAGETVSVTHDISALFDFESAGAGTFSFEPLVDFMVTKADSELDALVPLAGLAKAKVDSNAFEVAVSNVDKVALLGEAELEKRSRVSCSTSSYNSFISSSYTEGKALASLGVSYISQYGSSGSIYSAYFSGVSTSSVSSKLSAVANENSSSRTLSCSDPYSVCDGNVIAYTLTSTTNIYFCSIFYNEVATSRLCSGTSVASRNIRGGTTLHELTHAVASTDDVTYGCANDQALSASNKLRNADNYNCFVTQVYASTQC